MKNNWPVKKLAEAAGAAVARIGTFKTVSFTCLLRMKLRKAKQAFQGEL